MIVISNKWENILGKWGLWVLKMKGSTTHITNWLREDSPQVNTSPDVENRENLDVFREKDELHTRCHDQTGMELSHSNTGN